MVIAAGGWFSGPALVDPGSSDLLSRYVVHSSQVWRDAGFATVAVEHTSGVVGLASGQLVRGLGKVGFGNVVGWYDLIRYYADVLYGTASPVCVAGGSSAGNFALMLATVRLPSCVATEGAPTQLQLALAGDGNPNWAYATNAFAPIASGETLARNLGIFSPAFYPAPYFTTTPILMGHLADDPVVPAAQMGYLADGRPAIESYLMQPSDLANPPECDQPLAGNDRYLDRTVAHLCDGSRPGLRQHGVAAATVDTWRERETQLANRVAP